MQYCYYINRKKFDVFIVVDQMKVKLYVLGG